MRHLPLRSAIILAGFLGISALASIPALAELGPPGTTPQRQYVRPRAAPAPPQYLAPVQQPQRLVRPAPAYSPQPAIVRQAPRFVPPTQYSQPPQYSHPPRFRPPEQAYRDPPREYRPREYRDRERFRYRAPVQVYVPQPVPYYDPPQTVYVDPPVYNDPPDDGYYTPAYPARRHAIAKYCETDAGSCELNGPTFAGRSCRCWFPEYGKVPGVAVP